MFRRFVSPDSTSVEQEFDLVPSHLELAYNFNVSPSQTVPVIRVVEGRPELAQLRWGMEPSTIDQIPVESLQANAGDGALFANAQRCIVPALGFYAWQRRPNGDEEPFYVHIEDQAVCGVCGFWEGDAFVVATVATNALLANISATETRMPAILTKAMRDVWLYGDAAAAWDALGTCSSDKLIAYPVSSRVNSPQNNDESLIEPLETDTD